MSQNQYGVGAVGKKIQIGNLAPRPTLTPDQAIDLAAWLVATAVPLMPGDAAAGLGKFHKLLGDAAEGSDLGAAALAELEE